eukprot:s3399_g12.t1
MSSHQIDFFRIDPTPCEYWAQKDANLSRKRRSAKAYEVIVHFKNGESTRDKMVWLDAGAGRDCFKFEHLNLCLKWFTEVDNEQYKKLHQHELEGWQRYADTPVGAHLPMVHGTRILEVGDQQGRLMKVDCLLQEFAGNSLRTVLKLLNGEWESRPESEAVLREYFVAMLVMCEQADVSRLEWCGDFHTGNICYNSSTKRWYMVDLEKLDERTTFFAKALNNAGKRQLSELKKILPPGHRYAYAAWEQLLSTYMKNRTDWNVDLKQWARDLGVDLESIKAGSDSTPDA